MDRRAIATTLAAGLALSLAACTDYVRRGSTLYADGRYVEAAEVFERTEQRLSTAPPRQRAEYGLYRGMTFLALGDHRSAARWLGYAHAVERQHPGSLPVGRRSLLDRGLFELRRSFQAPRPGLSLSETGGGGDKRAFVGD